MLKRTKYSRLRNDSLTSLEDRPQKMLPLKRDLCLDSDFAQLDPGTPAQHGPSTLRDFIPRVANIRLQSPISLRGQRGQTNTPRDRTIDGHADRPLSRTEWGSGHNQRFCSQSSLNAPISTVQNLTVSTLHLTKRPITLHRMASLPWTPGCPPSSQHKGCLCCLKTFSAEEDWTVVGTANRAVHHHIKPAFKGLSAVLGQINLQFSGSRIILTVSTDSMTLIAASSLQKIAHHPMQAISFASGGDPTDHIFFSPSACHILECPPGRASEVINSIGQAFETRFRQLLSHTPSLHSTNPRSAVRICSNWSPEETPPPPPTHQKDKQEGEANEHRNYYNVIPGKSPPPGGIVNLRITTGETEQDAGTQRVCLSQPVSQYENCSITEETPAPPAVESEVSAELFAPLSETRIQDLIQEEDWFHGRLGREQAESLLTCSGDFLVRESSSASGQYVLSGMEGANVRHLLLVDPHGQVRTRDQVFLSVGHLVRFHMESQMPIVSGSSELCLKQPILH
ncbi:hypothetical protein PAMA_000686 [Pampus argenteus]